MHIISRRSLQDCEYKGSCTIPGIFPSEHRHLGAYCDEGMQMTDDLIKYMVNRE